MKLRRERPAGKPGKTETRTEKIFARALGSHQGGDLAAAERLYREVLALDPRHAGALHYLGILASQLGRWDLAETLIGESVAVCPDHPEARSNLGTALWQQSKTEAAAEQFAAALRLRPDYPEALNNLANALKSLGRLDEAERHYRRALALRPGYAEAHNNLGSVLQNRGRFEEAGGHYRQALVLRPDYPEALNNSGNLLLKLGRVDEAVACYEQALRLRPDYAEALNNLGGAFMHGSRTSDAIRCFERALALKADFPGALNNLGSALLNQGRLPEAIARFERAVALKPDYEEARRNLIYTSLYQPGVGLEAILAASRTWSRMHADCFKAAWPSRQVSPRAGARPRLGFVSSDFRSHVVGRLMIPVLEALGRVGHDFICYSNHPAEDALSERFKAVAAAWRPISGLDDDAAAARIRDDGIDILIDLNGFTADNRLPVFARKPAPLQITWLGYPATTGMEAMDYLFADHVQVPEGADAGYQEKIIRLPDGYHLYRPIPEAPEVGPSPAAANGFVTFGSFNGVQKLSEPAVELWSRILRRLPSSRLRLKAPGFNDEATQQRYRTLFAGHGIGGERLDFAGRTSPAAHMLAMTGVDIALDSFPYTGGATTVDTLWMGTPVITLPGETMGNRLSAGYLSAAGFPEGIARDADDYVERAVGLAVDTPRLASLHATLRTTMAASPLCDETRFVRSFEAACTAIWERHCAGEPPRSLTVPSP